MHIAAEASGPNARAVVEAINTFSEQEWGIRAVAVERRPDGAERDGTLLAIIAILLALPGSILATLQLLEKAQFKRRLAAMLTTVRAAMQEPGDKAVLRIGEDKIINLATATPDEVFEALMEEARRPTTGQDDSD